MGLGLGDAVVVAAVGGWTVAGYELGGKGIVEADFGRGVDFVQGFGFVEVGFAG